MNFNSSGVNAELTVVILNEVNIREAGGALAIWSLDPTFVFALILFTGVAYDEFMPGTNGVALNPINRPISGVNGVNRHIRELTIH